MDRDLSIQVLDVAWRVSGELDRSVALVKDSGADEETLKKYRRSVGHVMAELHDQIMRPIFKEHPDLEPDELR